ncbi:uncharacterized protein MELLADRAFT_106281 [Melampsora larici-populina 98AG31]|uniref:Uncharacterized protein n=1 Tax=Melampsora larici-populina (strain 98AG31 / pathotype 3-4-7) TaxID=747676 RepID=F4RKV5_MELLP|nr:uncharacterized protein MELLADRAFT_106281 [Melampsora larici-populina 98AG31]EGG06971.1 hypothetical protein MELLADRAFT_106281 [Melampsora larici-populina 98AG31]
MSEEVSDDSLRGRSISRAPRNPKASSTVCSSNDQFDKSMKSRDPLLRKLDRAGDLWRTREGIVIYWHGYKLQYQDLMDGIWKWSASGGEHARKKLVTYIQHERKPKHEKRVGLSDFVCQYRHKLLDEHIQRIYGDLYLIGVSWKEMIDFLARPRSSSSAYHQKLGQLESKLRFYLMISLREYNGLPLDPSRPGEASWPIWDLSSDGDGCTGWDIIEVSSSESSASSQNGFPFQFSLRELKSFTSAARSSSSVPHRNRRKGSTNSGSRHSEKITQTEKRSSNRRRSIESGSQRSDQSKSLDDVVSSSRGRQKSKGRRKSCQVEKADTKSFESSLKASPTHRVDSENGDQHLKLTRDQTGNKEKSGHSVASKAGRSRSKHRETVALVKHKGTYFDVTSGTIKKPYVAQHKPPTAETSPNTGLMTNVND